jgi:hypothetical protein
MSAPRTSEAATPKPFLGDLQARLDLVRERVDAEEVHLEQVAAVARSYVEAMPARLSLVRG